MTVYHMAVDTIFICACELHYINNYLSLHYIINILHEKNEGCSKAIMIKNACFKG